MATETSNIDDILTGAKTPIHPETPEHQAQDAEDLNDVSETESDETPYESQNYDTPDTDEQSEEKESEAQDIDDYGNQKEKSKLYTEDEVNERINKAVRDRLSRIDRNSNQPSEQTIQQKAQQFEYDPNSDSTWQQQLEVFVEQTVNKMSQKEIQRQQQYREEQAQAEFHEKFQLGMNKFKDFREVVSAQPISDPMTIALRGLPDPASFIYAASKKNPQELQRISQLKDPVMQMVEMGKLEERMRKAAQGTKAPRPVSRTKEDAGLPMKDKKNNEVSIEELIAKADAKRFAQLKARRGK